MVNAKKQDRAREIYKEEGSIKRTARKLKCSKAEVKRLLGQKWLDNFRISELKKRENNRGHLFPPSQFSSSRIQPSRPSRASGTIHTNHRTNQKVENPERVFPTSQGAFEVINAPAWGHILVPVKDPRFRNVTSNDINGIKLIENFPKIPADLWDRWIDLCFHLCHDVTGYGSRELEIEVLLCRKADDLTQWRMIIPKQQVSGASVTANVKECIDLATGEKFDYFPPPGWLHVGSSHSHNTMNAYFSSKDNESELSVPGLHIVVGNIDKKKNSYTYQASIVLRKLRKHVNFDDVVDTKSIEKVTFHPDVLDYVTSYISRYSWNRSGSYSYSSSTVASDNFADNADRWRRFWKAVDDRDSDAAIQHYNSLENNPNKIKLPTAEELLAEEDDLPTPEQPPTSPAIEDSFSDVADQGYPW